MKFSLVQDLCKLKCFASVILLFRTIFFFQIEKVELETDRSVAEVSNLFAKVDDRRQKRDVPDFLCGKISFEILKEPVITPSGTTTKIQNILGSRYRYQYRYRNPLT